MKTFASMIGKNWARTILLFGVLAGLFFSGGEGIQLLPFPTSEGRTSKIAASKTDENSKSYAFTVFSSRNNFTLLKSKSQKDDDHFLSGEFLSFARTEFPASFPGVPVQETTATDLLHLSGLPDSHPDRAPPVI